MPTDKQLTGTLGEKLVAKYCSCPRCKRAKTLRPLIQNFECADVICNFCGFLAQVKTTHVKDVHVLPRTLTGAAWGPYSKRMEAGIYFSLYIVLLEKSNPKNYTIHFLPAELQEPEMFVSRNPLSETAKRKGWQGFNYDLRKVKPGSIVRII